MNFYAFFILIFFGLELECFHVDFAEDVLEVTHLLEDRVLYVFFSDL